ncbi:hypothetical protein Q3G72_031258 [Acer saccharum]|nr:hypothetical protein Q3G72_031258 [Acer saccharum]
MTAAALNLALTILGAAAGVVGAVAGIMTLVREPSIKEPKARAENFGPALAKLQETIILIEPEIKDLNRRNRRPHIKRHANFSEAQICVFNTLLEKGKELVNTCKAIPGQDKKKKRKYAKVLAEVDSYLWDVLVLLSKK